MSKWSASSEVTNASTGLRLRNERSYSSASATIHDDSADGSNRLLLKFFDIPPRKAPHPFFDFCNNTAAIVLMVVLPCVPATAMQSFSLQIMPSTLALFNKLIVFSLNQLSSLFS